MTPATKKRPRVTGLRGGSADNITQILLPAPYYRLADERAERAVLGALLQRPELFWRISEMLQPGDFHFKRNGIYYFTIEKIVERGEQIDIEQIAAEAEKLSASDLPTGDDLLTDLASLYGQCPNPENIAAYAQRVRDAALRIRITAAADKIRADAFDSAKNAESLRATANAEMFEATEQRPLVDTSLSAHLGEMFNELEAGLNGGVTTGIPTGIAAFDAITRLYADEVVVLAGHAGMGKTTLLLSVILSMLRQGFSLVFFTLEMSAAQITRNLVSMMTGIPRERLQSKMLNEAEWAQFVTAMGELGRLNLHIVDDLPALTPAQFSRRMLSYMQQGVMHAVVIDGLWLMDSDEADDNKAANRHRAVFNIMRSLLAFAKAHHQRILITHQYKDEIRHAAEPRLFHLSESIGVQRNSEVVIGMWRQNYFDSAADSDTRLYLLKNRPRGGRTGTYTTPSYNNKFNRYED